MAGGAAATKALHEVVGYMGTGDIWNIVISVLLAIFGAIVMLLYASSKRKISPQYVLREIVVAAFIGTIVCLTIKHFHIASGYLVWVIAGISGLIGTKAIWFFIDTIRAIVYIATRSNNEHR